MKNECSYSPVFKISAMFNENQTISEEAAFKQTCREDIFMQNVAQNVSVDQTREVGCWLIKAVFGIKLSC